MFLLASTSGRIYRDVCHAMAQKIRCKNSVFCDRMTTKDIDNNQKDNTMKKIIYLALIAVIMGFLPTGCEKEKKYNENPSSLSIDGGSVVKKKPQNLGTATDLF